MVLIVILQSKATRKVYTLEAYMGLGQGLSTTTTHQNQRGPSEVPMSASQPRPPKEFDSAVGVGPLTSALFKIPQMFLMCTITSLHDRKGENSSWITF